MTENLQLFKDELKELLIERNGDIRLSDHKGVIDKAKELGLDIGKLSKLLQEVDASINWDYINKQKEEGRKREEDLKNALEQEKVKQKNAGETLQFIIDQCAKDKIFDAGEIKVFFETSDELKQNESQSANLLKTFLERHNYIPIKTPNGTSIRLSLESTDWYKDKLPEPPPPPPPPFPWKQLVVGIVLFLVVGGTAGYFIWLKPFLRDKNATRMYSFANSLTLRSSPQSGGSFNAIGNVVYGTEVLVYSTSGDWATCKANNEEGFLSLQYLLGKKDFYELNGILADSDTRSVITTTKCRKALMNYFNSKGIMGKIDASLQREIYGEVQNKEVWQVFAKAKTSNPNSIAYPKVVSRNSKFTDFACIIKNISTGQRRFLLFSFNDNEESRLIFEEEAPESGYIKNIYKDYKNGSESYKVIYTL